ncbi:type I 3-dehydroquinate dehydratase [Dialister sp.]|uniref:type I 3-dehydroquinate dehydratase n=1 Tax=Dialister sp. TaxID=1955814 RepID=UPI002E8247BB|nr:type I 3-dehydroquinate dehydratase [Dialister sp.]MEE3453356.1 type I 3-dehydroquinate dehydratase [Dialister sp.]
MLKVKNLTIGEGKPDICVPLVSSNLEDLEKECEALKDSVANLMEWRVDYLLNKEDFHATRDLDKAWKIIRKYFPDKPILTTVRTKSQGGAHKTPGGDYIGLLSLIIASRWADILDVEYGHEMMDTKVLVSRARKQGIPVLMSYHKFKRALSEMEILDVLENMRFFKPDIEKIAVMPQNYVDVAALISAAARFDQKHPEIPVITIGMGEMGVLTRISGNHLGGPITFAAGLNPSAPGQLLCDEVRTLQAIIEQQFYK